MSSNKTFQPQRSTKVQQSELDALKAQIRELEKKVALQAEQIASISRAIPKDSSVIQHITLLGEQLINLVSQQPNFIQPRETSRLQNQKVCISNYLQIDDFLSTEERKELLNYTLRQESSFVPTSIVTDAQNHRSSKVIYSFPQFSELIINRVQAVLPYVLNKLQISPFDATQIEAQLTTHNDGNYYKIHNDNGMAKIANRELTFVYYFYQEPKPFSGGELRIYDSITQNNLCIEAESFQTIEPRNNSIVFFFSRYMHEVLPVSCPSRKFADSRFTVNGWIRK
jgi:SM-20-related protein